MRYCIHWISHCPSLLTCVLLQELRESLQHVDSKFMSKIFNAETFGIATVKGDDDDQYDDEADESGAIQQQQQQQPTLHASDAIDYSDFNEAVPDDQLFSDKYYQRGMNIVSKSTSRLRAVNDDYDEEDQVEQQQQPYVSVKAEVLDDILPTTTTPLSMMLLPSSTAPESSVKQVDIKELFPAFEKDKVLKFSELFMTKLKATSRLQSNKRGKKRKME